MTPTQKLQQIKNWIFSWSSQHSFKRMTDDKGNQFEVDGDLSLGKELYSITEEGMIEPAKDGEYSIQGKVLKVISGLITDVIAGNRVVTEKQINEETKKETMAENVKMVKDSLVDGTEISISGDAVAIGAELRIIKDGEELLPPAGEHQLKSGSVVVVDESGKIIEVKPVEQKNAIEVDEEDDASEGEEGDMASVKDVIKDTGVVNIETIHGMMKQMMEEMSDLKKKVMSVTDKQETMKEEFSKFKKEPAAEPLKRNSKPVEYQFGSGDNPRVQMLEALRGHIKNK
jgi:hypothetical protein